MTDRPDDPAEPVDEAASEAPAEEVYSEEEEEEVEQRLRDLGYL
jgi:hypothetical protein